MLWTHLRVCGKEQWAGQWPLQTAQGSVYYVSPERQRKRLSTALYCPDLKCAVISWAVSLAPYVCAGLLLPPSLLFPSLSPPFSPATQSAPPPSLSLSLSGTQAARSFNRLGNGFISSNAVWSEAEPLTLSKRLPTAVMCFHTSQSTRPHRLTIFPHRRPPSLSLARSLFIYFTHSSSSYSQTDSPFPLPPSLSSTPSFSSLLFTSAWGFLFHSGHKALSYRLESAFLSLHLSPHLILHNITVSILPTRFNSLFLFLFLYLSLSLIIWELGSVGIPAGTEGWCGPSVSWWERGGHMYRQTTPTTNSPQLTDYLN